jgi:hypothetical protein
MPVILIAPVESVLLDRNQCPASAPVLAPIPHDVIA